MLLTIGVLGKCAGGVSWVIDGNVRHDECGNGGGGGVQS